MKQKAVAMATAFTMLLAVGVTGLGSEALHQHPAYTNQNIRLEAQQTPALAAPEADTLLLAAPAWEKDK